MTSSKKTTAVVAGKIAALKLKAANAEKALDAAHAGVHAAKENLKQARKTLKEAKIQAKQARKTLKAEKKLAKRKAEKATPKKGGK